MKSFHKTNRIDRRISDFMNTLSLYRLLWSVNPGSKSGNLRKEFCSIEMGQKMELH